MGGLRHSRFRPSSRATAVVAARQRSAEKIPPQDRLREVVDLVAILPVDPDVLADEPAVHAGAGIGTIHRAVGMA